MTLSVARWEEADAMPCIVPTAGEWKPMSWDEARTILASEPARNLDHWIRSSPEIQTQYEAALELVKAATEQDLLSGIVIALRNHTLSITPEIHASLAT